MNTKNLFLIMLLSSLNMALIHGSEKGPSDSYMAELYNKDKATKIVTRNRKGYTPTTALHRLLLENPGGGDLEYVARHLTKAATCLVQNGCNITMKAQFVKRFIYPPSSTEFPTNITCADLAKEFLEIDNKPYKEELINDYYRSVTKDKPLIIAVCKGIRSAFTPKEAATAVNEYLFTGPTSIVMGYVGGTTNSPEEEIEVAKLDTLIAHHQ